MSTDMPAVGTRVRVVHTQVPPEPYVFEGVVASHEPQTGCVVMADGTVVAVESGEFWSITVEVITPPLSDEPPPGSVARLTNARTTNMGKLFEHYDEGWFEARDESRMPKTWAELNAMGTVTPLVPAPFLAEMIEALRETAPAWHEKECTDFEGNPAFEVCTRTECVDWRALLAKVTGAVTA